MKSKFFVCLVLLMFNFVEINHCYGIGLPSIISDHMVLASNTEVTLWGWGKALEPLSIELSWDTSFHYQTQLNKNGRWKVSISTSDKKGPHTITFKGYNTLVVTDILFGEVWLCSGQSNMEWSVNMKIDNGEEEKIKAHYNEIRFFSVPFHTSPYPQEECNGQWVVCTPETMSNFSAVGYFYGKVIHQTLNRPVGLIQSAWGGTPAEVWVPKDAMAQDYTLLNAAKRLRDEPWAEQEIGVNYNGMIHPIIPFHITGALWYQGETNTANAITYGKLLSTLIQSWRLLWAYDFPFYYVQIAPYSGYGKDNKSCAEVRYQQSKVLDNIPNIGMVVVSDIGDLEDIHPRNKLDVGRRLANMALSKTYHSYHTNVDCPRYQSHAVINNELSIIFQGAPNGLVAKGNIANDIEIQNQDGIWYTPKGATVKDNKVLVNVPASEKVMAIRFAYTNIANPLLFNKEGLPASCFTTEY